MPSSFPEASHGFSSQLFLYKSYWSCEVWIYSRALLKPSYIFWQYFLLSCEKNLFSCIVCQKSFLNIENFLGQLADDLNLIDPNNLVPLPSDTQRRNTANLNVTMERYLK